MALRDIANVQVLRGPQGTLFGRNTIGGAVLMSTTDPGDEFGGEVRVGARHGQSDRWLRRARRAVLRDTSRRASRWACASRTATSRVPTARISATPTRSSACRSAVWTPSGSVARDVHRRLHQVRRERQPAGVRGHQRRRDIPARREPRCRMPGSHRRRGAAAGTAGPAAVPMIDDASLRQRSAGARVRTATTARCRCTARSRTSARRSTSRSISATSMTLKSITAYREHRLDRRARRRQHAADDPAHRLRRERRSVEPGAAAHLRDRSADRRVRPVLLRADLR